MTPKVQAEENANSASVLNLTASLVVADFQEAAGANLSEARLLLSYTPESQVRFFYSFVARILQEYGTAADLDLAEVRGLCKTPSNVQARGEVIEEFLFFVVETVSQFGQTAGASAREVKSISMQMSQEQVRDYYRLVQRLSAAYRCTPSRVKFSLSVLGPAGAEEQLASGDDPAAHVGASGSVQLGSFGADYAAALRTLEFHGAALPSAAEISRRFRLLARDCHPDKEVQRIASSSSCGGSLSHHDIDGAQRFRQIKAAADLLLTVAT